MTKKIFAMFLAVLMVVSMLPTSVFAAEATCPAVHTVENCTYEEKGTVAPTCKDAGYTVYQCTKCDATFVGNFNYELAEHTYEPAKDQAPTCSEPGYKGGLKCSVCGHLTGAEEVPALGEGVSCLFGDWDVTVFDCTKNFTATRYCVNCNAKDEVKYEVAKDYKGHVMGEWVKGENGVITRACTVTFTANGFTWKCTHTESSTALPTHPHTADTTLLFVAEVAAKCEKTGTAAHYVCRECGELFGEDLKATTAEKLVIASLHDQMKEELDCMTTTKPCDACDEYIFVGSAPHKFTPWVIQAGNEPSCVNAGLRERTCTVCGIAKETEILNPLGHATYSQTIEATCSMYKYTFTYCVRPGCTNKVETAVIKDKVSYDVTLGENVLTAPIVGLEFYMNLFQGNAKVNKELFFNGTLDSNKYLGTTDKKEEAVQVKLVNALDKDGFVIEGAYWLTFVDANGDTKYIDMYETNNKVYLTIADSSVHYFTWNETYKTLTATVKLTNGKTEERFLGTYNEYKTISCSNVSYLEGTSPQYVIKMTTYNTNGVRLMANGLTVTKGYAEDKHELKDLVYSAPTCQFEGTRIQYCVDCGTQLPAEVLPVVDHKWIADASKADLDKDPTCTAEGKKNLICEYPGCGETKVETIAAKGHDYETETKNGQKVNKVYKHEGHHADLLAYEYYVCKVCTKENDPATRIVIAGSQKAWDGATKIFEGMDAAQAAHPDCELTEAPALNVKGTCFKVGYTAYSCSGCTNTVRVKEAGSGEHEAAPKSNKADCLNAAGYITYICSKCETKVGEGTVGETFNKTADALGHKMKKNNKYVASTCENPNMDLTTNYAEYCERCDHKVHDYEYTGNVKVLGEGETLCTAEIWTEISCKEHRVHTVNHIGNYGHSYIQDPANKNVKPTCTTTGTNYFVCEYCDAPKTETVAKTNHKDADGEFSEMCLAKDRHCDLCCKANGCDKLEDHDCTNPDGDKKTDDACSCVKKADQHDYKTQYTGSTCEQYPTKATICTLCHKSKDVVQYTEYNKAPIVLGHKPVAAKLDANGDVIKYMGYTYKTVTYVSYIWVGEVLTPAAETYVAEYKEYTEASLTEGGKVVFECATCKQTITETTNAIDDMIFSAEIRGEEFTEGGLVYVDLYVNASNKELFGFNFNVEFAGMVFVGAEKANLENTFYCQTTPATQVTDTVKVGGYVAGTAKNVTVNEQILLGTLMFRVVGDKISVSVDHFDEKTTASKLSVDKDGKTYNEYFEVEMAKADEAKVVAYGDLDRNNEFNFNDIMVGIQILDMIVDYDYDVAGDIDYDGSFTITDLYNLMALYLENNYEQAKVDFMIETVGAEQAKLMGLLEVCSTCKTAYANYETHVCPKA